ncbi:MAG: hypothetical protein J5548_11685 [Prevotella sp.]|nr:hypothetical protein [Prevotella sp.]
MTIKSFMTMMVAAVVIVSGLCSCGDDDDEPEAAVATQVAGSYTGNEVIMVMGEESSNVTTTYEFTKASDITVNMTIPESGEGAMLIPKLVVKNIPVAKNGNSIAGKLASYTGTVTTSSGSEKAYTVSNVTLLMNDKTMVATFSVKYGNMPMSMETTFTGTRR